MGSEYDFGAEIVRTWTECIVDGFASNRVGKTRIGVKVKNTGKYTADIKVAVRWLK